MNHFAIRFLYLLIAVVAAGVTGCATSGGSRGTAPGQSAAAKAAVQIPGGTIEPSSKSLASSIAFERLRIRGLSPEEMWLPDTIRSSIRRNFTNFARGWITVINIADDAARSAEIQRSLSGSNDELSLVARTAARSLMTGTITKRSGTNRFMLELIVTETETSTVLASHSNTYSDPEQAVKRATEDLLFQLGLRLSDAGRQRLYQTSSEDTIALARGLNAEREGQNLQALNYLFSAQNFESTASQAAASLAVVQTTQQSAGVGASVIDHFMRQDFFQNRLNEYNTFYDSHVPFELFYTEPRAVNMSGSKTGTMDTRQFDLGFKVGLRWNQDQINVMERVLNDYILTHLNQLPAASRTNLELQGLPEASGLFRGPDNFKYILSISVENENGVQITSGSLTLSASLFYHNGRIYAHCIQEKDAILPNIKYVENQFRELYVVITSINGVDVRTVGESGFMRLVPVSGVDLPPPNRDNLPRQVAGRLSSDVKESAAEEKRIRDRETEGRRISRVLNLADHPMHGPYYGVEFNGGYIVPTNAGILDIGLIGGWRGISGKVGFLFYPGLEKEQMKKDMGADGDVSTIGFDFGGFYSFLNPKWNISLGGGVALVRSWEDKKSQTSSSSDSGKSQLAAVGNVQLWFDWFFSNMFLKIGYRGDFFPGAYRGYFFKEPQPQGKLERRVFWGHGLMFGVSYFIRIRQR